MAGFDGIISGLRRAEREVEAQLAAIRAAIASLRSGGARAGRRTRLAIGGATPVRRRRRMSAAARKRISDAQKARWARQKAAKK